ncbi:O-antigen ligase [Pseudobutyrivibrio sp. OR37]|uniref:O-antigen ligase family protein n=1 Tax=Pseudobutyrivibrio sp. OR37 TaxID=1798186 RepID=UPI0008E3978C|nr:O-antigen ligase family protein [Pseudobutyrivibrio sp. OR37]SFH96025.1 O-antigen ligase [Pseudobutyrivibrio sp. OR37]
MIINVMEMFRFILLMPIFNTQLFQGSNVYNNVILLIRIVTIVYWFGLFITRQHEISRGTYYLLLLQIEYCVVTIINNGWIEGALKNTIGLVAAIMIIDIYINQIDKLLRYLVIYSYILVYGNALTMLVFPHGLRTVISPPYPPAPMWLISVSNSLVFWLYPIMLFLLIDYRVHKSRLSLIAAFLAGMMNIFSDSTTGLVGSILMLSIVFLPNIKKIVTPFKLGIISIVLFVMIIIVGNVKIFEPIIIGILSKDMTFSSRDVIWANAVLAIINKPLLGYGALRSENTIRLLGVFPNGIIAGSATHCHSEYLQVVFKYGLIGCIWLFIILFAILYRTSRKGTDVSYIFGAGIAITMIMGITEVFTYPLFYFLVGFAYVFENVEELAEKKYNNAPNSFMFRL